MQKLLTPVVKFLAKPFIEFDLLDDPEARETVLAFWEWMDAVS